MPPLQPGNKPPAFGQSASLRAFVVAEIQRSLSPKRVFDMGFERTFLVEAFRHAGIEAWSTDSLALTAQPLSGRYDLVTCLNVVEYMARDEAIEAIRQITAGTDAILFSSVSSDFDDATRINVRPLIYWLRLFAGFQFAPALSYDASFISANAVLLRPAADHVSDDILVSFDETVRNRIYRAAFVTQQSDQERLRQQYASVQANLRELALQEESHRRSIFEVEKRESSLASRLAQTNKTNEFLDASLQEARSELADAQRIIALLRSELANAQRNLTGLRNERDSWKRNCESSDVTARAEAEMTRGLRGEIAKLKQRANQLELIREEWAGQNKELRDRFRTIRMGMDALEREMAEIRRSPGWRALEAYRAWLQKNYANRFWVRGLVDPGVRWVIARKKWSNRESPLTVKDEIHGAPVFTETRDWDTYKDWIAHTDLSAGQLEAQRQIGACLSYRPKVSVLTPVYKVPWTILRDTIQSIQSQTYENWELCLAHGNPDDDEQRMRLRELAQSDCRIKVDLMEANEGISENSNRALALATGEFVALLDHDDTLAPTALFDVVELLNRDRSINFIYSDKDQIAEKSDERVVPLFKPAWSPDVMLSANYLTHLCVMRTGHVRALGGFRKQTDGAQDWDLFLRVIARYGNVRHLPKVLYHWRQIASSVAMGGLAVKPYAADGQVQAVGDYCRESGLPVEVAFGEREIRVSWPIRKGTRITLIRVSAREEAGSPERSTRTDFPGVEELTVYSGEDFVERLDGCVRKSSGDVLVFLDDAVTPASTDWLCEMVGPLQTAEIGITGAKLIDPETGLLRHCGIVVVEDGGVESIYSGFPEHVNEVFGPSSWYRNWSAVSGACFAMQREVWMSAMASIQSPLHYRLDIHICLNAVRRLAKRVLYTPYARLYQTGTGLLEECLLKDAASRPVAPAFSGADAYFHPQLWCKNGAVGFRVPIQDANEVPRIIDYAAESRALTSTFDFSLKLVQQSKVGCAGNSKGGLQTITWFLPEIENAFYGGVHTVLRFADWFFEKHGIRSRVCIIGHGNPAHYKSVIGAAFPNLAAWFDVHVMGHKDVDSLPACDAAVATLWTTAYAVLHFTKARQKFYFIQDDEALFYPAGSSGALVEATYGFGFAGICNTVTLLQRYRERGGDGEYFTPAIDPTVFHSRGRMNPGHVDLKNAPPYTLFCYGRPGHARNSFELLCAILIELKKRFGKGIRIYNAGARWSPKTYGLENVAENLGLMNYQTTGALYRACDAGLVMMMTRHPSYLPMELMACSALVVTNRNPDTAWLLKDRENCLLAEPGVTTFADQIEEGLRDTELRRRIVENARAEVASHFTSWQAQMEKIHRFMSSQC
jgi:glycosyltransferase involved in cell wall biosynthesis